MTRKMTRNQFKVKPAGEILPVMLLQCFQSCFPAHLTDNSIRRQPVLALPGLGCRFRAAAEDAVRRRADDDLPYLYRVAFATLFDRLHVVILRIR